MQYGEVHSEYTPVEVKQHKKHEKDHWRLLKSANFELCVKPEEHNETIGFNEHSDEWVSEQDHKDSSEECDRSLGLVPLEEKPERPLQTNDKC